MKFKQAPLSMRYPTGRLVSLKGYYELGLSPGPDGPCVRLHHRQFTDPVLDYFVGAEFTHQALLLKVVELALANFKEATHPKRITSAFPVFTQRPYLSDLVPWRQLQTMAGFVVPTSKGGGV